MTSLQLKLEPHQAALSKLKKAAPCRVGGQSHGEQGAFGGWWEQADREVQCGVPPPHPDSWFLQEAPDGTRVPSTGQRGQPPSPNCRIKEQGVSHPIRVSQSGDPQEL